MNNGIKNISETHGLERKEYFRLMYNVLFGRDSGPKLTQYILFAGANKIVEHINKVMNWFVFIPVIRMSHVLETADYKLIEIWRNL